VFLGTLIEVPCGVSFGGESTRACDVPLRAHFGKTPHRPKEWHNMSTDST